jgi:integrase
MTRPRWQKTGRGFRKQVRDPETGKRVSVTADSPEALLTIVQLRRDVATRQKHGVATAGDVAAMRAAHEPPLTVADCWRAYEKTLRPGSLRTLRSVWKHRLEPSFGAMLAKDVSDLVLETWSAAELARGAAPKTIDLAWFTLRGMIRLQCQAGKLGKPPWDAFRPPRDPEEPLDKREAARSLAEIGAIVLEAAKVDHRNVEQGRFSDNATRILVTFLLGLRNAEVCALGWDDLDLDPEPPLEPSVAIRHQAAPNWSRDHPDWIRPSSPVKGRRSKRLILHSAAVEMLRRQRRALEAIGWYRKDGPVFPGVEGAWRRQPRALRPEVFRDFVRRAGLPRPERWVPHSLRHSTATLELMASGFNVLAVQKRLRHASPATTWGYAHQLQRGATRSSLPDLPMPVATPLLGMAELVTAAAVPELPPHVGPAKKPGRFERAWDTWLVELDGDVELVASAHANGKRPKAITEAADRAYTGGYKRAMRKLSTVDHPIPMGASVEAGRWSRKSLLGAWTRYVNRRLLRARGTSM